MSIQQKLRSLQDQARDSGWRIKWIHWQEQNTLEFVYNTPLTLATGFGGALMFLGSLALLFILPNEQKQEINKYVNPVVLFMVLAVTGLVVILLGRFYAAWHKQSKWVEISAMCIDREIKKSRAKTGNHSSTDVWAFRVLCTFDYNGSSYTVTPESPKLSSFSSEAKADKYLNECITSEGKCTLFVDPQNPLHAVFDKKQII